MAKTQEELFQLKVEYENLSSKLKELTEDELNQVTGGNGMEWLYEHSFDGSEGGHIPGSIQEVIGDWDIKEH